MNLPAVSDRAFLGRAIKSPLKLLPRDAQMRILQGPLRGKKWILSSGNHRCWLGSYEHEKLRAFSEIIGPGHVIYDLGANVGYYSLLASALSGSKGRVFSFEPSSANIVYLKRHLHLNNATNCTVFEAAVGRAEGTARFDPGPNRSMGRLAGAPQEGTLVRVVSLDTLVRAGAIPPADVIKCDIEGGEYDALLGSVDLLEQKSPTIFLATHGPDVHKRCCGLLTSLGYNLTSVDGLSVERTSEILAVHPEMRSRQLGLSAALA